MAVTNRAPTSGSGSRAVLNEMEKLMRRLLRPAVIAALLALAAALLFGSGLLTAGAGPAQTAPGQVTPLPDFKPSEELPADAAVAFPTDI